MISIHFLSMTTATTLDLDVARQVLDYESQGTSCDNRDETFLNLESLFDLIFILEFQVSGHNMCHVVLIVRSALIWFVLVLLDSQSESIGAVLFELD